MTPGQYTSNKPRFGYYVQAVPVQYRSMRRERFSRRNAIRATLGDFFRGLRATYWWKVS